MNMNAGWTNGKSGVSYALVLGSIPSPATNLICPVWCSMGGLLLNEERGERTAYAGNGELTAAQDY